MENNQEVKNQVKSAHNQIWQQIESAQQYLRAAQQDVHKFVEQQRAQANHQQTSQVVETARQAASAKVADQLQTAAIQSETQAKLRELVARIQGHEHPSQQQAQQQTQQQTVDVTETAGEIFNQVTQLFEALSSEPINQPRNLDNLQINNEE